MQVQGGRSLEAIGLELQGRARKGERAQQQTEGGEDDAECRSGWLSASLLHCPNVYRAHRHRTARRAGPCRGESWHAHTYTHSPRCFRSDGRFTFAALVSSERAGQTAPSDTQTLTFRQDDEMQYGNDIRDEVLKRQEESFLEVCVAN